MMKLFRKLLVISSIAIVATSCTKTAVEVESLIFIKDTINIKVNETADIGLKVTPEGATNYTIHNYTSSTVSLNQSAKTVTGLKIGAGKIYAYSTSDKNINALLTVNVNGEEQSGHYTGSYYNGLDDTGYGTTLLGNLQTLNTRKLSRRVGYNSMFSYYPRTDGDGSRIIGFYNGSYGSSSSMNREHVWPASKTVLGRDKDPLEDDIHMVRPTFKSDNSSRGNEFFVEGKNGSNGWDPANCGNASYRGDSARIIFYCVVADSQLSLVDKEWDTNSKHTMGKLSDLLRWNLEYPVLGREDTRNDETEKIQGNRNPFIDHPEYACKIWGNTNSTTKAICGM